MEETQPLQVPEVGPHHARALASGGALLLDVREPEEWTAGHAPGAVHVPLGELGARLDELPRERDVVVVCRSGARSFAATTALVQRGAPRRNLSGGMHAWRAEGFPVVTDEGVPGVVA